ncbi:MAG: CBS domain-containing protein [Nitrososphaeraceae archaeon]|nr:CBS domain-containing protein [Nitrososphaeraceae archaeon]
MNPFTKTVGAISDDAIKLDVGDNILNARNTMIQYNISRVVITQDNMPAGMITEKDIVRFIYSSNLNKRPSEIKICEVIGNKPPITVGSSMLLVSCARLMLSKGISSLIVTQKNSKDLKVITKTDLVNHYSKFYKQINKVKEYMTTKVYSISPDELLIEAMKILLEKKVSRVAVVKNGKAVGIITGRDLLPISSLVNSGFEKYSNKSPSGLNMAISGLKAIIMVGDIMRSPLLTIFSNADLADAAKIMIRNRISGLPVVDKNDKLIGIVTKTDVIRAFSKSS